ncbi:MAG TPA: hypothetical protein DD473_23905, partial [Planctomycetaceae bacterium]|nr:hypothetical protein [Planctomycetaceae bacterium]
HYSWGSPDCNRSENDRQNDADWGAKQKEFQLNQPVMCTIFGHFEFSIYRSGRDLALVQLAESGWGIQYITNTVTKFATPDPMSGLHPRCISRVLLRLGSQDRYQELCDQEFNSGSID